MVTQTLDEKILETAQSTKKLCTNIKEMCKETKSITYEMMTEMRDLNAKQDHIIRSLKEDWSSPDLVDTV